MTISRFCTITFRGGIVILLSLLAVIGSAALAQETTIPEPDPYVPAAPMLTPSDGQIAVSWSAATDTTGATATGYGVEYRVSGASSWTTHQLATDGSTATSATITGLTTGTTYDVRLQVEFLSHLSSWSAAASARASTPSAPGAPASISVSRSGGPIHVTWTAPSDDGNAAITGYHIETSTDGQSSWTRQASNVLPTPSGGFYSQSISSGLASTTGYHVSVQAVNSVGTGARTKAWAAALSPPGKVKNLSGTRSDGRIDLSWPDPSNAGSSAITGYTIAASTDEKATWTTVATGVLPSLTNGKRTYSMTNVDNSLTYEIKVRAVNAAGGGKWSDTARFAQLTPRGPIWAEALRGDGFIDVEWWTMNGTSHDVRYRTSSETTWTSAGTASGESTDTLRINGTTNSSTYVVAVRSHNSYGTTDWKSSPETAPATTPYAVGSLSATRSSSDATQIDVTWKRPSSTDDSTLINYYPISTGGSPINGYRVDISSDGGTTWRTAKTLNEPMRQNPTKNWSTTLTGLNAGTAYKVAVYALNRMGASPASTVDVAAAASE